MILDLGDLAAVLLVACVLASGAALAAARRLQRQSGLPRARVVYTDTGAAGRQRTGESLIARRYGLVGKPDYLIEDRGQIVPVEVKPSRYAAAPYPGDILQLLAYCLLVEETAARPPYGLLRYASGTFRIDYTDAARAHLLEAIAAVRTARREGERDRSHDDLARCAACMFGEVCDQSLARET